MLLYKSNVFWKDLTLLQNDINTYLNEKPVVHFIGIGGISMSALALILNTKGYTVKGSDMNIANCSHLIENGIKVYPKQAAENIENARLVVYTAAIKQDNPELMEAKRQNIPCFERADLLGAIINKYSIPIGVAGTHGKSTTTSMVSCIMLEGKYDPTISVGAVLPQINSNYHIGSDEYFIFESCEYAASFLKFFPRISLILNVDEDHLDFYKDIDDIIDTFRKYTNNTIPGGLIITNAEDENCLKTVDGYNGEVITFGINKGDYTAKNIDYSNGGCPSFTVCKGEKEITEVSLNIPGEHNILNSLAAAACCDYLGVAPEHIKKGLESFIGAQRRFQFKGKKENFTVIDDYAHHPSEIEATLNAAKKMDYDNVILIFQPHTYSRTKALMPNFEKALALADKVILCDIYAAREKDTLGVSSQMLAEDINGALYAPSFEQAAQYALQSVKEKSLILTMGAGDVYKIADILLK